MLIPLTGNLNQSYGELLTTIKWRLRAAKALEDYMGCQSVDGDVGYELLCKILKRDDHDFKTRFNNNELEICKSLCGPNGRTIYKAWCIQNEHS